MLRKGREVLASFPGCPPSHARNLLTHYVNCTSGGGEPGNKAREVSYIGLFKNFNTL